MRSIPLPLLTLFFFLNLSLSSSSSSSSSPSHEYQGIIHCLSNQSPSSNLSQLLHTPNTSSYSSILISSIKNLLFSSPTTPKPLLIITPSSFSDVQASVLCCKNYKLQMRVRSGGHDYEGLSYRSAIVNSPFTIIDLARLRSVDVDTERTTAWVQSGATIGEFYYKISKKLESFGFPAGICHTVGVGGQLSGGGFGTMQRKHGLAADNVVDAMLVNAEGELLDRETMGEDLFWAIRGGGSSSFGIIVSWKVKLVPVPRTVTVFTVDKIQSQGATNLIDRWEQIAHKLHEDLFIRVIIQRKNETEVEALFNSLFLGSCEELLTLMDESFAELGFGEKDCNEMSWIESAMYFDGYRNGEPLEILLNRGTEPERYFKATSDFVTKPIGKHVWDSIWSRFLEEGAGLLILDPFGGRMDQILDSETPFPHRRGNLYNIQYFVEWRERGEVVAEKHVNWIRRMYEQMRPYVSENPRGAYVNYRDLEIGVNEEVGGVMSYVKGKKWGERYYKGNFERLARVKGRVDGGDFFRSEQSVPPLFVRLEDASSIETIGSGFYQRFWDRS